MFKIFFSRRLSSARDFFRTDIAFVSKWLTEQGLTKVCIDEI